MIERRNIPSPEAARGCQGGQPSIAEKPNEGHTHGAEVPLGGSTRLPRISGGERILHSQSPGGGT